MDEELVVVSVKMPYSLLEKIDSTAYKLGIKRSELIRLAVMKYLEQIPIHEGKMTVKRYVLQ